GTTELVQCREDIEQMHRRVVAPVRFAPAVQQLRPELGRIRRQGAPAVLQYPLHVTGPFPCGHAQAAGPQPADQFPGSDGYSTLVDELLVPSFGHVVMVPIESATG